MSDSSDDTLRLNACVHIRGVNSTLKMVVMKSDQDANPVWLCKCTACGKVTEPCLLPDEAVNRAERGWWIS